MYAKLCFVILFLTGSVSAQEWTNTTQYMDKILDCFSPVARADADELIIPTLETVHLVINSDHRFARVTVQVHNKSKIAGIEGLRRNINCSEPVWSSAQPEEMGVVPPWFDGRDIFECILHLPILHIRYEGSVKIGDAQPVEIRVSVKVKQADVRSVVGTIVEPNTENVGVWMYNFMGERKVSVIADGDELPEQLISRLKEFFLDFSNRNKHYYPLIERVMWRGLDQCIRKIPLVPAPAATNE